MTLIYKINDLERKIPYKQWEALKKEFVEFAKDKKQIETNWDELKDWLKVCLEENNKIRLYDNNSYQAGEINTLENVIDKMQELERGKE